MHCRMPAATVQYCCTCSTLRVHAQCAQGIVFFGILVLMLFVWSAVSLVCVPVGGCWTERRPLQYSLWVTPRTHTYTQVYCSLCLSVHATKTYGSRFMRVCICVCICMSVTRISRMSLKNKALENAVQAQRDNISNLIFWIKALFTVYGMIAHLKRHCGAFQTLQKTNLLAIDFLANYMYVVNTLS